jgi:dTDP-4-amino-4,6-dideoxygalactose transaminase
MGTIHEEYQHAFARFIGAEHAFAFWKGRVALYAMLRALGIGKGDEVILPGYTCVMDVNPIMYVGATPVYVDVDPITYNMAPHLLEAAVTDRTKLILAQHTYGYPVEMDEVLAIAKGRSIPVVEDCCLALGSRYRGRLLGTMGLAAYFSFQWNKPYTSGLGGMAVTSDDALAADIRGLCESQLIRPGFKEVSMLRAQLAVYRTFIYPRTTAMAQNLFRRLTRMGLVVGSSGAREDVPEMAADFFKGMSPVQCRAGLSRIAALDRGIAHRKRLAGLYDQQLDDIGWPRPAIPDHHDPVLVRYPVRVANKERALAEAARHYVELGSWFECPLHPKETPMEEYGYRTGMCPVAERASAEVVNLPVHPRANERTVERTVKFIRSIGPADAPCVAPVSNR